MEDKNRNQERPNQTEQGSIEEFITPHPNEVETEQNQPGTHKREINTPDDQLNHQPDSKQRTPQPSETDGENIQPKADEEETKSPLSPIDKNKAPEDWQQKKAPAQPKNTEESSDEHKKIW